MMKKIQTQGVRHITLIGADRQTSIDFWEGVMGMPFIFEQPNLDVEAESHLYFDPGDGRLIIKLLVARYQGSLSTDRTAKDPYREKPPVWD